MAAGSGTRSVLLDHLALGVVRVGLLAPGDGEDVGFAAVHDEGTVLVASPSAIGRMPEASGSRVPAWPAFLAERPRFTTATAWVEVMPTPLSRMIQPLTSRFFGRSPLRALGLG